MNWSMRRAWDRVRTVPGLGRDVAAVTALILAAIFAGLVMWPKMSAFLPWQDTQMIRAEFQSVPGVNPKSLPEVTIAGVKVGQIVASHPTNKGTAVVDLQIEGGQTIYNNARAVLRPKNPLNDMMVEINPGGAPGKPLPTNGLIPLNQSERPVQVDEVLNHLDERTQQAVTDLLEQSDAALVRAPEELPAGLDETNSTLVEMRPVVEALDTRREKIRKLVGSLAQISSALGKNDQRVGKLVDSTQQTLRVLGNNDQHLQATLQQVPGLSKDLHKSMLSTQNLTDQLDPTLTNLGAAAKDLPNALDRFNNTAGQLGKTVDKAQPVVDKARPAVADLRPLVTDLKPSLNDLVPVTKSLKQDTGTLTRYADDIRAFVYNTSSVFGAGGGPETGVIRGHLTIPLPGAGVLPNTDGYAPGPQNGIPPEESPQGGR